jgi:hypothetical protein
VVLKAGAVLPSLSILASPVGIVFIAARNSKLAPKTEQECLR